MVKALNKAHKVADKLKSITGEVEFWNWYDKEIKQESQLVDDRLTFGEAIAKVEADFWSRLSRTKRVRDRNNPSDLSSWRETYGRFYDYLPKNERVSLNGLLAAINKQTKGNRSFKYSLSAMKKLCRFNQLKELVEALMQIDDTQTVFTKLQTTNLEDFLVWRDKTLGVTSSLHKNAELEARKAWLWVFSMQIVYALRISEVFAIKNLFEPYVTDDSVVIPALNDFENTANLIYIGDKTILGTTVKTGGRIARPLVPPKHPDLIEKLELKNPTLPSSKPKSRSYDKIRKFYSSRAAEQLRRWNAPFSQTHALRHLGNLKGMQAGIPLEIRAQSMGHTPAMNDSTYKKRQSTRTTIDLLLNSNQNAIDFVTALAEAKKLVKAQPEYKDIIAQLLSIIYQKNQSEINELL